MFDNNDVFLKLESKVNGESTIECNIGTKDQPRLVRVSKLLPLETRTKYIKLLKEFTDIFSWSYSELKTYDKSIMEHKIPLKTDANPVARKIRHINPMKLPIIEKDIKKLWEAKIILPLKFSNWVPNIVPVWKKNGEIRICFDFCNLNRCSLKDNYPLPKMDYILQKILGSKILSMIYGFSGYNQISFDRQDREKTTFTTPRGTFMNKKIPFGLMKAGATF